MAVLHGYLVASSHPQTSFTPERWQRLQELFELAQPLDAEGRTQLLLKECGEDVALREQVVALLLASSDQR